MVWKTEFSVAAERNFRLIFDHLFQSYVEFGEAPDDAFAKAAGRICDPSGRMVDRRRARQRDEPRRNRLRPS